MGAFRVWLWVLPQDVTWILPTASIPAGWLSPFKVIAPAVHDSFVDREN